MMLSYSCSVTGDRTDKQSLRDARGPFCLNGVASYGVGVMVIVSWAPGYCFRPSQSFAAQALQIGPVL